MMKFDGIAAFIATAEAGSISAAARRLGLAKSVVSERLAELERVLGTKLIQRTTRKLTLTENGHTFLPRAQRILREADEASAELAARSGRLAGPNDSWCMATLLSSCSRRSRSQTAAGRASTR